MRVSATFDQCLVYHQNGIQENLSTRLTLVKRKVSLVGRLALQGGCHFVGLRYIYKCNTQAYTKLRSIKIHCYCITGFSRVHLFFANSRLQTCVAIQTNLKKGFGFWKISVFCHFIVVRRLILKENNVLLIENSIVVEKLSLQRIRCTEVVLTKTKKETKC